jgi:peptidoglycan hydrolase-like protein with peptidoglycan-binding domain
VTVDLDALRAEHAGNVGFTEGPHDQNPWSEEVTGSDTLYCLCASTVIPHHHGYDWPAVFQNAPRGAAYCPWFMGRAIDLGWWEYDHASQGHPCDLLPYDIVLIDWDGDGTADHAETVKAVFADGTFDTWGYNTGRPQGCHQVRRNRKYLLGRVRPPYVTQPSPASPTPPAMRAMSRGRHPGRAQPQFDPFSVEAIVADLPIRRQRGDNAFDQHDLLIQRLLQANGRQVDNPKFADGRFGQDTAKALIDFQQATHVDDGLGVCGPRTWRRLLCI